MSQNISPIAGDRKFHTSIIAVSASVLLFGSVQCILNALQPLRPAVIWLINRSIEQGHFQFSRIAPDNPLWLVALLNLLLGAIGLCLSYLLASWNYKSRTNP